MINTVCNKVLLAKKGSKEAKLIPLKPAENRNLKKGIKETIYK